MFTVVADAAAASPHTKVLHLGGSSKQHNYSIVLVLNNETIGSLDFSIYNDVLYIKMVEIEKKHKGKGYSKLLYQTLLKEFDEPIYRTDHTEEGQRVQKYIPDSRLYKPGDVNKKDIKFKLKDSSDYLDAEIIVKGDTAGKASFQKWEQQGQELIGLSHLEVDYEIENPGRSLIIKELAKKVTGIRDEKWSIYPPDNEDEQTFADAIPKKLIA